MKIIFRGILLTLSIILGANTILPSYSIRADVKNENEVIIVDELVEISKEQLDELNKLIEESNGLYEDLNRNLDTDYIKYIQRAVSKEEAKNIKNAYTTITGFKDSLGYIIGFSTFASYISTKSKYEAAKSFIVKYGTWGSNILLVVGFIGSKSIDKFTKEVQSAVDEMNDVDELLFRVESDTVLEDQGMCRYVLKVRKAIGWNQKNGKWYYIFDDGSTAKGWKEIGGVWYYFDTLNGEMKTGWQSIGGAWYYFWGGGSMAKGWLDLNGNWYYLDSTYGYMKTNWQQIGGKWYYFYSSGIMATNIVIDGWKIDGNGVATPLRSVQNISESSIDLEVNEDIIIKISDNIPSIDVETEEAL